MTAFVTDDGRHEDPTAKIVDALAGLTSRHITELRSSGLSDEQIAASGVYSEDDLGKLQLILNRRYPKRCGVTLVFPYRDPSGHLNGFKRVKPDNPRKDRNGRPIKYESPSGQPNRIYVSPGTVEHLQEPKTWLWITEGEKKALAADQAGFRCVGLVGVFGWKDGKKADRLSAEMEAIAWQGRRVVIAFDSDVTHNADVCDAESRLAAQLTSRGAIVKVIRLPDWPDGGKVGLDDFLVAKGKDALHELLKEAQDPESVDAGTAKLPAKLIDAWPEAEMFVARFHSRIEGKKPILALRSYRDEFYGYNGAGYAKISLGDIRAKITRFLHANYSQLTFGSTSNVLDAVKGIAHVQSDITLPAWLEGDPPFPVPEILATKSGLIHLPSLVDGKHYLHVPTPRLFTLTGLDYAFDADAPRPGLWLEFLGQIWGEDRHSIEALQEWFGLMLTPDTSHQKILALIGPTRAGKGVIARVLRMMVGENNSAAPTLAGLATNFGLWPLIGKTLAVISDARLSGRTDAAIVTERLLSISGEDAQTIDRKCLEPVTTKLAVRFLILTNEVPRLIDTSGALAGRLIVLRLTQSFYGHEDKKLTDKLGKELPGIVWWSIRGWQRLRERGHIVQPQSGEELLSNLRDLTSPVGEFVRGRCVIAPTARVHVADIYRGWREWCEERGRKEPGSEAVFGRDLHAVVPTLKTARPRENGDRPRVYEGIGLKVSRER